MKRTKPVEMREKKFGFTITLKPEMYDWTLESQYLVNRSVIHKKLRTLRRENYCFAPELTQKGNIHFHGYVSGKFNQMFAVRTAFLDIGFTNFSSKYDERYMKKDYKKTRKALHYKARRIEFTKDNYGNDTKHEYDQVRFKSDALKQPKLVRQDGYSPTAELTAEELAIDFDDGLYPAPQGIEIAGCIPATIL